MIAFLGFTREPYYLNSNSILRYHEFGHLDNSAG
jgi:hypothetical protein